MEGDGLIALIRVRGRCADSKLDAEEPLGTVATPRRARAAAKEARA
jgi:hypothetical protein